jgi:hypothetical protein
LPSVPLALADRFANFDVNDGRTHLFSGMNDGPGIGIQQVGIVLCRRLRAGFHELYGDIFRGESFDDQCHDQPILSVKSP